MGTLRTLLDANSTVKADLLDRKPKAPAAAPVAAPKSVTPGPANAKPVALVTKPAVAKTVSKSATPPSIKPSLSASGTKNITSALKPATTQAVVPKATIIQTPKAAVAAPAHPASVPHPRLPAHTQTINRKSQFASNLFRKGFPQAFWIFYICSALKKTMLTQFLDTGDISLPSATLANSGVGHENYYTGSATHDTYGNPLPHSNTLALQGEGAAGNIDHVAYQGSARDINASQYNQEDEGYGGRDHENYDVGGNENVGEEAEVDGIYDYHQSKYEEEDTNDLNQEAEGDKTGQEGEQEAEEDVHGHQDDDEGEVEDQETGAFGNEYEDGGQEHRELGDGEAELGDTDEVDHQVDEAEVGEPEEGEPEEEEPEDLGAAGGQVECGENEGAETEGGDLVGDYEQGEEEEDADEGDKNNEEEEENHEDVEADDGGENDNDDENDE